MFVIRGVSEDGRDVEVSWFPLGPERMRARPKNRRGLVGDEDLIRRAIEDEMDGRSFGATVTGPFLRADLDDARAAIIQLTSYFPPGYSVEGEPPPRVVSPVGEDAVA